MRQIVNVEFRGVAGPSGHLEPAVTPVDGLADDCGARDWKTGVEGHRSPPHAVTVNNARARARCISGILKPFSASGRAPSAACDAAPVSASGLTTVPVNAASTAGSR